MTYKVFIDGQAGTTGLKLAERLAERPDIELIEIAEAVRKDTATRMSCIAAADVSILCLPDDGAREIVSALGNPDSKLAQSRIIDCSTAFRTAPGWTYGMPEISAVDGSTMRIANPGCHATGFILAIHPLVKAGVVDPDTALSIHSLTGYSGGGKAMIAEYENAGYCECGKDPLSAPRLYGLSQTHKHLPEMQRYAGIVEPPFFSPVVCNFYNGMLVSVPLQPHSFLRRRHTPEEIRDVLAERYEDFRLIKVREIGYEFSEAAGTGFLSANAFANRDDLEILVTGKEGRIEIIVRYDNLGKGASGAAIQNMNRMLGLPDETGLVTAH